MAIISLFKEQLSLVTVEKAKRRTRVPWQKTRTKDRLDALHQRMGSAVSADLFKGLTKFKGRINPEKIYDAWTKGDWAGVVENVPWEHLEGDIGPALERGADAIQRAGVITRESMPLKIRPELRWDTKNPRVREWIKGRTASNFVNLSQDSAKNIQTAVTASLNQALTPRQVAQRVRDSIGLLPRHAAAVRRYTADLGNKGYPPSSMQKLGAAYADRLLDYRANMIGQTETRLATNQGQISVWRQAADQGLVDKHTTGKRWIVDGDPCPDCEIMDGVTVPLDSFFVMDDGSIVDFPPMGTHPFCFCGMEIVYDIDPDEFEDSDE